MLMAPIDIYVGEPRRRQRRPRACAAGRSGRLALYGAGQLRARRRHAEAGAAGWVSCAPSRDLRAARRRADPRAQLEYRLSAGASAPRHGAASRPRRLRRDRRHLRQRAASSAAWTPQEVALLYALATISFAFTDLAIGHLDLFPQMIREGTFDQILVRPLPSLFQLVAVGLRRAAVRQAAPGDRRARLRARRRSTSTGRSAASSRSRSRSPPGRSSTARSGSRSPRSRSGSSTRSSS